MAHHLQMGCHGDDGGVHRDWRPHHQARECAGNTRHCGSPNPEVLSAESASSHPFEITAGPLGDVLDAFQKASGLRVVVSDERIRSLSSPGVSGAYTSEQALTRLLEGTDIQYKFVDAGTVKLSLSPVAQSVTVSAQAEGVGLTKYSQPVLDTPQTISVVPQHIMQEQGTTTLRDALRNVAGISLAAGEGGSQGDNLTIRGFTARNDIFLDGMRDFGSYYRDPFDQESIAVLQGPSSVVFGRGSTGGVVSQTSKMPRRGDLSPRAWSLGTTPRGG